MLKKLLGKYSKKVYEEDYMNKPIDKDELEEVTGGVGEYIESIISEAKTPGEQLKDVTTNPDAKPEQGAYKKTGKK